MCAVHVLCVCVCCLNIYVLCVLCVCSTCVTSVCVLFEYFMCCVCCVCAVHVLRRGKESHYRSEWLPLTPTEQTSACGAEPRGTMCVLHLHTFVYIRPSVDIYCMCIGVLLIIQWNPSNPDTDESILISGTFRGCKSIT